MATQRRPSPTHTLKAARFAEAVRTDDAFLALAEHPELHPSFKVVDDFKTRNIPGGARSETANKQMNNVVSQIKTAIDDNAESPDALQAALKKISVFRRDRSRD